MPNQINSNNTPKTYDAGDLLDANSIAESDMKWMNTAISHVRKEIKRIHALSENGEILSQYHFSELITHLDMYEYLAENRLNYYSDEAKTYQAEWEAEKQENKKAVSL